MQEVLASLIDPRANGFIVGEGARAESLEGSIGVAQIFDARVMTCRTKTAVWEPGVAGMRVKSSR